MGCGSCGTTSADGKPSGCQSNGNCSSGGCNRLNVFNWLAEIPLSDFGKPFPIVEVSFNKGSRKDFFRNNNGIIFDKGNLVTVEGVGGFDVGEISLTGELVKLQLKKNNLKEAEVEKKLLRASLPTDIEIYQHTKSREKETLIRSRAISKELNLEMKIAEAEYQADAKKITFFYTADSRVDFRELIKIFASEFKAKVEMRQIGARQESAKVGSIGSCGRELCCSTWLTEFKTVNTTAARYQNLSINQTKLSGQCGRLKCCLNYELDTYMDALKEFPPNAEYLEFKQGRASLQKKDIFRNLMWYGFSGSSKQYPLAIERVIEILALNAKGSKPEEIEAVEIQSRNKDAEKTVDMGFVNDVGQIKLSSLKGDNSNNKKRKKVLAPSGPNQRVGNTVSEVRQNRPAGTEKPPQKSNRERIPARPKVVNPIDATPKVQPTGEKQGGDNQSIRSQSTQKPNPNKQAAVDRSKPKVEKTNPAVESNENLGTPKSPTQKVKGPRQHTNQKPNANHNPNPNANQQHRPNNKPNPMKGKQESKENKE